MDCRTGTGKKFSLRKMAIATPSGNAMSKAIRELKTVPNKNGSAPNFSRFESQTDWKKKFRPVFWIAGQACCRMLTTIQTRVATVQSEAAQQTTKNRSNRRPRLRNGFSRGEGFCVAAIRFS